MADGGGDAETLTEQTVVAVTAMEGQRIGRFVLGSKLGAGGMGVVFAATDPVLDRRVAIKLIRPGSGSGGVEARLLREAQALARLTHPNVVTVHEAGVANGAVFIAMELIDGTTLREWMAEPHAWRDAVAVFAAAGAGLAAAHAAGMIHRDFKPANVLIDRGGRVKVSDFGLVGIARDAVESTTPPPSAGSVLASPLTQVGAVMGTPAYMAPEQLRGAAVDARADQYAFCKSLDEAVVGATDPPPPRLRAIVARGLAADPARRFPAMTDLLAALDRVVHRRRQRVVIGAAIAVAVSAAAIAVIATRGVVGGAADPCAARDPLAAVWPARRDQVRVHLVAVDPVRGARRFAAIAAALDAQADRLRALRRAACRANRVTRTESDTLYDRRERCLDRRGGELATAVDAVISIRDLRGVDAAAIATQDLSAGACTDAAAVSAQALPPADAARRREVDAIVAELGAIARARITGALDGLEPTAAALVARARATHHDPALAAALRADAEALAATGDRAREAEVLRELTEVAAAARDDDASAWAWTELFAATRAGGGPGALALAPAARAALVRTAASPAVMAQFLVEHGGALADAGKYDEARIAIDEATAVVVRAGADLPDGIRTLRLADAAFARATIEAAAGRWAAAEPGFRQAVELWGTALGPDHPVTIRAHEVLGEAAEAVRIRAVRAVDRE